MSFPLKLTLKIILYLLALIGAYHLLTGDFRPFVFPAASEKPVSLNMDNLKNTLKEKFSALFQGTKKKAEDLSADKMKETAADTFGGILDKAKNIFSKKEEASVASGTPSDLLRASMNESSGNETASGSSTAY